MSKEGIKLAACVSMSQVQVARLVAGSMWAWSNHKSPAAGRLKLGALTPMRPRSRHQIKLRFSGVLASGTLN
jgi:hypothetical protein